MTYNSRTKLYKIPSEGRCMGVCAGVADYFDMKPKFLRIMFILAMIFTGIWPLLFVYFVLGFALESKPGDLYNNDDDEAFWKQTRKAPDYTAAEMRQRFRDMERRTAEMEAYMTSKRFKLERELNGLED